MNETLAFIIWLAISWPLMGALGFLLLVFGSKSTTQGFRWVHVFRALGLGWITLFAICYLLYDERRMEARRNAKINPQINPKSNPKFKRG